MKTEDIIIQCIEEVIKGNNEHSVKCSLPKVEDKYKIYEKKYNRYIYNEASFQYELGIALRETLGRNYMIQFERNIITFDSIRKNSNINDIKSNEKRRKAYSKIRHDLEKTYRKLEIDIIILNEKTGEKYALELKYHGQDYPEVPDFLFGCAEDMSVMKKLSKKDFISTFCIAVTEMAEVYYNSRRNYEKLTVPNYLYFGTEDGNKGITKEKISNEYSDKGFEVVKKAKKSDNKIKSINIEEFYFDDNEHLPLVEWKTIDENNKIPRYYIVKFKDDKRVQYMTK